MKTNLLKLAQRLFIFALIVILFIAFSKTEALGSSGSLNVKYHSQQEIIDYINAHPANMDFDSPSYRISFDKNPVLSGSYQAGVLSSTDTHSALNLINNIRYIAGISSNVTLKGSYNELAQAASIISYANGSLSHTPAIPSKMSKTLAKKGSSGAGSSNIAWASWQNCSLEWTIINTWMSDSSSGNISTLGHRRWILNPAMGSTGFGAVSGSKGTYSAMYIFDEKSNVKTNYQVAWPAQNMPVSYFTSDSPWSISFGKTLNEKKVSVTLTRLNDNKTWEFNSKSSDGVFYVNNNGYGQKGCIIFRPNISEYNAGNTFKVTINGVGTKKIEYTVNFFDIA